jgi:hypothetical protein
MATKYTITKILVTFIDIFAKDLSYFLINARFLLYLLDLLFKISSVLWLDYNTFKNILLHNNNNDMSRKDKIDASVYKKYFKNNNMLLKVTQSKFMSKKPWMCYTGVFDITTILI